MKSEHRDGNSYDIRVVIPATLAATERVFAEFRLRAERVLEPCDYFAAELLVREALNNAIVHGSQSNPAKQIHCALRMRAGKLIISVSDEGAGFDWRKTRFRRADTRACSGRGMEIFRKYATWVRFSEKGNVVTVTRDFCLKPKHADQGPETTRNLDREVLNNDKHPNYVE